MESGSGESLQNIVSDKEYSVEKKNEIINMLFKNLLELWSSNLLIGKGYYHSDLHPGNILVDLNSEKPTITLIDYGCIGFLNFNKQLLVIKLVFAHLYIVNTKTCADEKYIEFIKIFGEMADINYSDSDIQEIIVKIKHEYEILKTCQIDIILQCLIKSTSGVNNHINPCILDFGNAISIFQKSLNAVNIINLIDEYVNIIKFSPFILTKYFFRICYYKIVDNFY